MGRRRSREPATALLGRFGWLRRTIRCRDENGRRTWVSVRRRNHNSLDLELPQCGRIQLSNVEAGQLRAAIRDLLIDEPADHLGAA